MTTLEELLPTHAAAISTISTLITSGHVTLAQIRATFPIPSPPSKKQKKELKTESAPQHIPTESSTAPTNHHRHAALRILYDGELYGGFSENVGSDSAATDGNTVETHIFIALRKLKLIVDRKSANYSRCGRTDKGVSAFGQVVSLNLRSSFPDDTPLDCLPSDSFSSKTVTVTRPKKPLKKSKAEKKNMDPQTLSTPPVEYEMVTKTIKEYDYCRMLNAALPPAIRCIAWTPVTPDFSSRFSCTSRTYRYFFVRRSLDLDAMRDALSRMEGDHDFRNLAKMDTEHVSNFRRLIYETSLVETGTPGVNQQCYFQIKGQAFLWHMVRNIVAVLFFVGKKQELPSVVDELFDIEKMPRKPNYKMADDFPLVLHRCDFSHLALGSSAENLWHLQRHLEGKWERLALKASQIRNQIESLGVECVVRVGDVREFEKIGLKKWPKRGGGGESATLGEDTEGVLWAAALDNLKDKGYFVEPEKDQAVHTQLAKRQVGLSYEEKVGNMKGKRRERYEECQAKGKGVDDKAFYSAKQSAGSLSK